VVKGPYVPDAGDLVWLTFDPQAGREQRGRRPALILSPRLYNDRTGLAVACPITFRAKGYPFEVAVPAGEPTSGVVLADHLKSVDWKGRRVEFAGKLTAASLGEVRERIRPLLGL
jgi:mRNA interferase MazF